MRVYTVHLGPGGDVETAALVKEGFSWPALFLGPIWSLYRRLWLATAVWLAVLAILSALSQVGPTAATVASAAWLAFGVLFACEANDLRRRKLARLGWREAGVVGGSGQDAAARRFADLSAIARAS
jgi:hypothetical protein